MEDEDEEISDEKSLLELARTRYRTINLSWHYRSKYQDLINFSNHAFYDGLLNVAPNAINDPQHPPIRWIKCDGVWDNQTNAIEAKRVVDEIQNIWKSKFEQEGTFPSIGVVTFNEKQQDLIKDFIDKRKETDPEFLELYTSVHEGAKKDDTLFVKNIENVQGDERDIIIFSVGYAKDADGRFANFFGTLSMKGGENRLNVAVTRARKEMIVVSSIEPADIKPTSKNDGPKRLRQFLEYAKMTDSLNEEGLRAVLSEINPDMKRNEEYKKDEFDSEFEIQVCNKLRDKGHRVETQVGFSGYKIDLAVVHPHDKNRYILGIECDGATFHSAKSVRERDVMRQKFLEEKGWTIERIWSRNWWLNPKHEIDRIDAKINELVKREVVQR
jgi:superfamily I DNA and/or RNA helicase